MPGSEMRRAGLCLLACLALAGAHGVDDAAALVQAAVHAHGGRRAVGGLGQALETVLGLAGAKVNAALASAGASQLIPGLKYSGSMTLTNLPQRGELGSLMDLQIGHGCDGCKMHWGEQLDLYSKVHLASPLQQGDQVLFNVEVALDVSNPESFFSKVFKGDSLAVQGLCQVCDGSCKFRTAEAGDYIGLGFPTLYHDDSICTAEKTPVAGTQEFVLLDRVLELPFFNATHMGLAGHVNLTMAMLRKDGATAASAGALLQFSPQDDAAVTSQHAAPAEVTSQALDREPGAYEAPERKQGKPGLLQLSLHSLVRGMAERFEGSAEGETGIVDVVVTDLFVRKLEGEQNRISIAHGSGCEQRGSLGSVGCNLHFDSEAKYSSSAHLDVEFEQGSYMVVTLKPKVSGIEGKFMTKKLKQFEINELELPICGDPYSFEYNGEHRTYKALPCGPYSLNLELHDKVFSLPAPSKIPVPGFQILNKVLPMRTLNIAKLPPMSVDVRLQLFHQNSTSIADLDFKFGVDKAF